MPKPTISTIISYIIFSLYVTSYSVLAEVTTDGTVGPAQSLSGPDYQITQDLGETRGGNLFHSFQQFNLSSSESATFSGDSSIQNVIARVTGGSESFIDGTLSSTIPNADVYMVNPSGIVFGENAQLDVGGSFYATTADYLSLGDDGVFHATQPSLSLLTTSPPAAFGFLGANVGSIHVNQSQLAVPEGETLALVAGDINIDGNDIPEESVPFNDTAIIATGPFELHAPGGQVSLIAVASEGEATISSSEIDVSGFSELGDINLINKAYVSTKGDQGGTVFIRGGEIYISESVVDSATLGDQDHIGAGIDISARSLTMESVADTENMQGGPSAIQSSTFGGGNAGDVNIDTDALTLDGNQSYFTNIATRSFAGGGSGKMNITAGDITVHNAGIQNQVYGTGVGNDTSITAQSIILDRNAIITADTGSSAQGGNLNIDTNNLTLSDSYRNYFSGVMARSYGNGTTGDINIDAQSINMSDYAQILNLPYGYGASSGDIDINTVELNITEGASIHNNTYFTYFGYAGDINIQAENISIVGVTQPTDSPFVLDGTGIKSGTYYGSSGDVTINSSNITLDNRAIIQNSDFLAGSIGNTIINFDTMNILGGSQIASGTFGEVDGGAMYLTGKSLVVSGVHPEPFSESPVEGSPALLMTSSISSQTGINGGSAGDINIDVNSLKITDGGRIDTATFGTSDAASIIVNADTVEISGRNQEYYDYIQENDYSDIAKAHSFISSASQNYFLGDAATGDAGDVLINAKALVMADFGEITTASFSNGEGGNLDLNVANLSLDRSATINTNAHYIGDGGDLSINAQNVSILNGSNISASSSEEGQSGKISFKAHELRLGESKIGTAAKISDGGEISFEVTDSMLVENSNITTKVDSGIGSGGNIVINPKFLFLNGSEIRADAAGGDGGNIRIVADNMIVSKDSVISASSSLGIDGQILVQAPNNDVTGKLQKLPQSQLNPADLFRNPCTAGSNFSQFQISKKTITPTLQFQTSQESKPLLLAKTDCGE